MQLQSDRGDWDLQERNPPPPHPSLQKVSSSALHFTLNRKRSVYSHRKALGRGGDEDRRESKSTDKRLKLFIQYLFRIQIVLRALWNLEASLFRRASKVCTRISWEWKRSHSLGNERKIRCPIQNSPSGSITSAHHEGELWRFEKTLLNLNNNKKSCFGVLYQ